MTLIPKYKKCPVCKKKYSWDPDVGQISCPRCRRKEMLKRLFQKNRSLKSN